MLTNLASDDQIIGLGCVMTLDWAPAPKTGPGSPNYWSFSRPYGDSIAYTLGQFSLLRLGFVNARSSIGVFHSEGSAAATMKLVGTRPLATRYDRQLDQFYYGNFVSDLAHWLNSHNVDPVDLGEHNVAHSRYTGRGLPIEETKQPWYEGGSTIGAGAISIPLLERYHTWFRNGPFHKLQVVSTTSGYVLQMANTHSSSDWARPRMYFDDAVKHIASLVESGYDTGWWQRNPSENWLHREVITDFSCDHIMGTNGSFTMEYTHSYEMDRVPCPGGVWSTDLGYRRSVWHVKYTFDVVIPSPVELYNAPGTYDCSQVPTVSVYRDYANITNDIQYCDGSWTHYNEASISDSSGGGSSFPCYWCHPFFPSGGFPSSDALGPKDAQLSLNRVAQQLRHLTPASALSSIEAVGDFIDAHETNFLETVSELGDIASLVPDLKLLVRSLIDIKSGNLSGVVRLGDFIAETNLKYRFGVSPNLVAVSELNDLGPRLVDLYDRLGQENLHVIYGSFSDTLDGARFFGYEGNYNFVARSKLVVRMRDTSFLRLTYGATALGLAPNLRNVWETLPGSFAIDWVVNLKQYFDRLDKQFLLLTLLLEYCVHTYSVDDVIPEEVLIPLGIRSHADDPLRRKVFIRHVSVRVPIVKDSKYGFLPPSPVPSWDILGSLAWVLGLR